MEAPFFKLGAFSDDASLLAAFLIGGAFGFFLERAGFGSSRKLASQFYFRDMSVLKVMFTAIVTAMVGLTLLSQLGFVDLSLVSVKETRLLANLVGGLVLGVGFVIGGYCPGTSVVGAATGRVDGMLYVLGLFAGMFVVGFAWPAIQPIAESASMGQVTLPAFFHIPYGIVVFGVCLMAAGMFVAAEWGEMKASGVDRDSRPLLGGHGFTPGRVVVGGLMALGALAAVLGDPYRGPTASVRSDELARLVGTQADQILPADLADRIIAGDNTYRLIDLRDGQAYAAYRIPGAESIPLAELDPSRMDAAETWIVYAEDGVAGAQAWVLLKAHGLKAYSLRGGLSGWRDEVLNPVLPEKPHAASAKRILVARHFGGTPRGAVQSAPAAPMPAASPLPPPAAAPGAPTGEQTGEPSPPPKKKKKREGC